MIEAWHFKQEKRNERNQKGNIQVNSENQNSIDVLKRLYDIGTIRGYEFNVTPADGKSPEKMALSITLGPEYSPDTLFFERSLVATNNRTLISRKETRRFLSNLALTAMIAESSSDEGKSDSSTIKWSDLSFDDVKTRIDQKCRIM